MINDEIINLILDGLFIEGEHHKQWILDQILLKLAGEDYYNELIEKTIGEWGESWEKGISP